MMMRLRLRPLSSFLVMIQLVMVGECLFALERPQFAPLRPRHAACCSSPCSEKVKYAIRRAKSQSVQAQVKERRRACLYLRCCIIPRVAAGICRAC